jgi:hypothetical protein
VVVPAGDGLVPPASSGPGNAKARRAREMSRAAAWAARRVSRAVSATDSLIGPMPGGHGWPP